MKLHLRASRLALAGAAVLTITTACSGPTGTPPGPSPVPPPTAVLPVASTAGTPSAPETSPIPADGPGSTTTTSRPTAPLPDVTAAPLDLTRLQSLLPSSVPGNQASPSVIERTNEDLIAAAADSHDEADDVELYHRLGGVAAAYEQDDGMAHIWIDLLADTASAHGYLLDVAGDAARGMGALRTDSEQEASIDDFPISIGDQSMGLIVESPDGTVETAVLFRLGRLVAMTSLVRDGGDYRVSAEYLARQVADTVVDALVRGVAALPIASPGLSVSSHRFSLELDVSAGEQTLSVAVDGVAVGADLNCRITVSGPSTEIDRELRRVDGATWGREAGRDWERVGANALDAALSTLCPAWPLGMDASGLSGMVGGEAAELTSGELGDLLGYRGDEAHLAAAVGAPMRGVTVDTMNAWITEGTGLLVELNVHAIGPPAALVPLVGPWPLPEGGVLELELHHRVTEIGEIAPIGPPT